ncbi:MAG TPA: metalloregulator ArsR/SmtB family transcription factor [Steroidobacteraceae bacterium]|nr:metalloregulator ArsR/SmtB family transcription factor [Steroidobacteraceae bacterium]
MGGTVRCRASRSIWRPGRAAHGRARQGPRFVERYAGICVVARGRVSSGMSGRRKASARSRTLPDHAPVFAALGDEMRLKLLTALCVGGAMSITQLTAGTEITRQAVTKHLGVLASVGLVRDLKVGRERLWEFEPAPLDEARRSLQAIAEQWDRALARLKEWVER